MKSAIVLFSGGIDSTTALHWALRRFAGVSALTIDYGQKHRIEVEMAQEAAARIKCPLHLVRFPLKDFLSSALLDEDKAIPASLSTSKDSSGVPPTYVPFRNGIFLSLAAAFAESQGFRDLVTGFNRIDSPDYPDTSPLFTRKMQVAINSGTSAFITGERFRIHTPLIRLSKKEIILLGMRLGADYSRSISCYRGGEIPCGKCPACEIRSRAFSELLLEDPLIARLRKEGKQ